MKCDAKIIRSGFNNKTCLVHARCCYTPTKVIATAQPLNIAGADLFSGILMSECADFKSFTPFKEQENLAPIADGHKITSVFSNATPMYHKKTGTVLLIGNAVRYKENSFVPMHSTPTTLYSILKTGDVDFSKPKVLEFGEGVVGASSCCQCYELNNGDILVPVYENDPTYQPKDPFDNKHSSKVVRCSFDGENLKVIEIGNTLTTPVKRGFVEPSVFYFDGTYYLTLRNDDAGYVATSTDGVTYSVPRVWRWDNGEQLENYNTQQHFMKVGNKLYLVYTRRDANNGHVFRHRAPLFAAEVKGTSLIKSTEFIVIPERGARLGNFGATQITDTKAAVMVSEWMQPKGCEKWGSNNAVWLATIEE